VQTLCRHKNLYLQGENKFWNPAANVPFYLMNGSNR
jgi:hypothetical protein